MCTILIATLVIESYKWNEWNETVSKCLLKGKTVYQKKGKGEKMEERKKRRKGGKQKYNIILTKSSLPLE